LPFRAKIIATNTAARPDPSPFSYERAAAKKIRLKTKAIKAVHILLGINPAEMCCGGKNIKLLNHH